MALRDWTWKLDRTTFRQLATSLVLIPASAAVTVIVLQRFGESTAVKVLVASSAGFFSAISWVTFIVGLLGRKMSWPGKPFRRMSSGGRVLFWICMASWFLSMGTVLGIGVAAAMWGLSVE